MHPNKTYRGAPDAQNLAFARDRAFGTLMVNGPDGPLASHIPFLLEGDELLLHLVRSNPIARLGEVPAVIAVTGPDGYVSPDWYGAEDQVPTWNYVAVHLRGTLHPLPPERIRELVDRLSDHMESRLLPKPPWQSDKMTQDALDRMLRQILPFRLEISSVDGTWKLNQNKPDSARLSAADHMAGGIGSELDALAALMRDPEQG